MQVVSVCVCLAACFTIKCKRLLSVQLLAFSGLDSVEKYDQRAIDGVCSKDVPDKGEWDLKWTKLIIGRPVYAEDKLLVKRQVIWAQRPSWSPWLWKGLIVHTNTNYCAVPVVSDGNGPELVKAYAKQVLKTLGDTNKRTSIVWPKIAFGSNKSNRRLVIRTTTKLPAWTSLFFYVIVMQSEAIWPCSAGKRYANKWLSFSVFFFALFLSFSLFFCLNKLINYKRREKQVELLLTKQNRSH